MNKFANGTKPYTVIVLYPDYATDDHGRETYTAHVTADTPTSAKRIGQAEAQNKQPNDRRGNLDDWEPLLVFPGHINPVAWGWQS